MKMSLLSSWFLTCLINGYFSYCSCSCCSPQPPLQQVHKSKHAELVAALVACVTEFYGKDPSQSEDYGRLCTVPHAERLVRLMEASDGVVRCGGASKANPAKR